MLRSQIKCPVCGERVLPYGTTTVIVADEEVETTRYICINSHNLFVTGDQKVEIITEPEDNT